MMHDQGCTQGMAFLNRALTATSRAELDALPDAAAISIRLALADIDGADDQGKFLDGFAQVVSTIPGALHRPGMPEGNDAERPARRVMTSRRPTPPGEAL